jgi:hypothetical protein
LTAPTASKNSLPIFLFCKWLPFIYLQSSFRSFLNYLFNVYKNMAETRRKTIKQQLFRLLKEGNDMELIDFLANNPNHLVINVLFSALGTIDELVRWRAIEAFGKIVPVICNKNAEDARIVMRRMLWALNEESGGIGWGVPEAMAEILANSTTLRREYLHMFVSYTQEDGDELFQEGNYLELPLLQRGLLWGIGRLAENCANELLGKITLEDMYKYLRAPDWHVVGLAVWCLGLLGKNEAREVIETFSNNSSEVRIFVNGQFVDLTISELSRQALARLKQS